MTKLHVISALFVLSCVQPPPPVATQPAVPLVVTQETQRTFVMSDACRTDIPDCVAACALRETGRTEFIEFYDRRCAAVIIGKNPDKAVEPVATPVAITPPTVVNPDAGVPRRTSRPSTQQDLGF